MKKLILPIIVLLFASCGKNDSLTTAATPTPPIIINNPPVDTASNNSNNGTDSSTNSTNTNSNVTTGKRFLFDATHAETAGNADWVIDEDNSNPQRIPTPLQSNITSTTSETYWTGALSSFGITLVKKGQIV